MDILLVSTQGEVCRWPFEVLDESRENSDNRLSDSCEATASSGNEVLNGTELLKISTKNNNIPNDKLGNKRGVKAAFTPKSATNSTRASVDVGRRCKSSCATVAAAREVKRRRPIPKPMQNAEQLKTNKTSCGQHENKAIQAPRQAAPSVEKNPNSIKGDVCRGPCGEWSGNSVLSVSRKPLNRNKEGLSGADVLRNSSKNNNITIGKPHNKGGVKASLKPHSATSSPKTSVEVERRCRSSGARETATDKREVKLRRPTSRQVQNAEQFKIDKMRFRRAQDESKAMQSPQAPTQAAPSVDTNPDLIKRNAISTTNFTKGFDATINLTVDQIKAFREVFGLFVRNGGGTIIAKELDASLRSSNIYLEPYEIRQVLTLIDNYGKCNIDFQEFLQIMANAERFLLSLTRLEPSSQSANREGFLFKVLTKFMKKSALNSIEESVGGYHTERKNIHNPHVVNHYAAAARLIGLNEKQLLKHLEKLRANSDPSSPKKRSPYAQLLHILISKAAKMTTSTGSDLRTTIRLKVNRCSNAFESTGELMPQRRRSTITKSKIVPKPKGWETQRMKHVEIRLHYYFVDRCNELTAADVPEIRAWVNLALEEYRTNKRARLMQENIEHWICLESRLIPPQVYQDNFRKIFALYANLKECQLIS